MFWQEDNLNHASWGTSSQADDEILGPLIQAESYSDWDLAVVDTPKRSEKLSTCRLEMRFPQHIDDLRKEMHLFFDWGVSLLFEACVQ